jgi:hypothetical protein
MSPNDDIRDRLLLHLPQPRDLTAYRKQVASTLERNQKRIRLERLLATPFWIFCAVTASVYIWFGNEGSSLPRAPFLACIFLLLGALELLKYHIHSAQVELQKEVKQLQIQVLELQSSFSQQSTGGNV